MEGLMLFTFLLISSCRIKFISAIDSTNFGKRFLVSVPFVIIDSEKNVFSEITFALYSPRYITFQVLISSGMVCRNETVLVGRKHNSSIIIQDCSQTIKAGNQFIRTPYLLTGPHLFSVTVTANHFNFSSETMMAVPVEGWGTSYYAVTLRYRPTIQIITDYPNELRIDPFVHVNGRLVPLERISQKLPSHSTYELISCSNDALVHRDYTGTHIFGQKPMGVVTGNCQGATANDKCITEGKIIDDSIAKTVIIENLLPAESFGKEFIAYNTFSESNSMYVIVLVTANYTMVNTSMELNAYFVIPLEKSSFEIQNIKNGVRITSNSSVEVMVVRKSSCISGRGSYKGQAVMSLVLPTALFLPTYNWRTPKSPEANISDYVIFIAMSEAKNNLQLDGVKLLTGTNMEWTQVEGSPEWFIVEVLLSDRSVLNHYATSLDRRTPFGCYLYGLHSKRSYMHPAGFISSDLTKQENCSKKQYITSHSDYTDNDCDGFVDEEVDNHIDDDKDSYVDEDTFLSPVDGQWGEWTQWMCTTCNSTIRLRERSCDNPEPTGNGICIGEDTESGVWPCECQNTAVDTNITISWEANAYWDAWSEWKCLNPCVSDKMFRFRKCFDKKIKKASELCEGPRTDDRPADCGRRCAPACPAFRWRTDCKGDCSNCEVDCDKLNGSCARCRPGYKNPQMSCYEVCDQFYYGYLCQEQCTVKCDGEDCVDRVTGACPEQAGLAYLSFLLLIVPPVFVLLYLRHKNIQAGNEDPLAFIVESPSNLGIPKSKSSLAASRSKTSDVRSATNASIKPSSTSIKIERQQNVPQPDDQDQFLF